MTDDQIIELYFERNEQAIQATSEAYGGYCGKVASNILKNAEDVEEAVSDTWLRAWNSIPPSRPQVLRLFLGRITRNLSLSMWRARMAEFRGGGEVALALDELAECVSEGTNPEAVMQAKQLDQIVSDFLKTEPQNHRIIFLRRYFYLESSNEIALRLGISDANVRMILSRTRKRLKKCLAKEGYLV